MTVEARLQAVTQLRDELKAAKPKAQARAREIAAEELRKIEAQLNAACRAAYEEGASYAAIGRALGTKDFSTTKSRVGSANTGNVLGTVVADFHYVPSDTGHDGELYYGDQRVDFVQYQDSGTVDFFGELNDAEQAVAVSFLRKVGAIS